MEMCRCGCGCVFPQELIPNEQSRAEQNPLGSRCNGRRPELISGIITAYGAFSRAYAQDDRHTECRYTSIAIKTEQSAAALSLPLIV